MLIKSATLYVYHPDGEEMISTQINESTHVPREGELLRISDHSGDDGDRVIDEGVRYRVTRVETEYRKVTDVGLGGEYTELVYVSTEQTATERRQQLGSGRLGGDD